jgi:type I restriction-modification system DNA methylase subunit
MIFCQLFTQLKTQLFYALGNHMLFKKKRKSQDSQLSYDSLSHLIDVWKVGKESYLKKIKGKTSGK